MATRDDILQYGMSTTDFLAGAAIFLVQATSNWSTTGFSATAFPTKIDDMIDLTGSTIGRANSTNGWRNIGYTDGIQPNRSRDTVDLEADQAAPVRTLHDKWTAEIDVTALETDFDNLQDGWVGDPTITSPGTTVTGGAVTQYRMSFGSPSAINYRRVAIIHPDVEGRLWAYVFATSTLYITSGAKFSRTGRVEWQMKAKCYPDTRIAAVHDRVLGVYYTNTGFLTG